MEAKKYPTQFPHGLMFHRVHREVSSPSGQGSITDKEFEHILCYVGIENILSSDEWLYKLKHNKLNANNVCITFDDGLKCQYDICLPILEKYNIRAFWFVYSSVFEGKWEKFQIYSYFGTKYFSNVNEFFNLFLSRCEESLLDQLNGHKFKRYAQETQILSPFYSINDLKFRFLRNELLSKEEFENIIDKIIEDRGVILQEIAKNLWLSNQELKILSEKGHCIGLHSYDHPWQLSALPYQEQLNEYARNYNHVKRICNKEITAMSHPINSYNTLTLKVLSQLGIVCGFRSNMVPPIGKKINPSLLEIAREDPANILRNNINF